jgi:flagellar export protein FliJ
LLKVSADDDGAPSMSQLSLRFARLLRIRGALRTQRQESLAAAMAVEDRLAARAAGLEAQIGSLRQRRARTDGILDVRQLVAAQQYEASLRTSLDAATADLAQAAAGVAACRESLVEAHQELRIAEQLHQRDRAARDLELARRAVREIDELALRSDLSKR